MTYELIPFPLKIDLHLYSFIKPSHKFRSNYLLTDSLGNICQEIIIGFYLCSIHIQESQPVCETETFTGKTDSCHITNTPLQGWNLPPTSKIIMIIHPEPWASEEINNSICKRFNCPCSTSASRNYILSST